MQDQNNLNQNTSSVQQITDVPPMPDFLAPTPPPTPPSTDPNYFPPNDNTTSNKKFGKGKIIATFLGILLLVAGVTTGIILVLQPQLLKQNAQKVLYSLMPPCSDVITCPTGLTCNTTTSFCVDLSIDDNNCGSIGHVCPTNYTCTKGTCSPVATCGTGLNCQGVPASGASQCISGGQTVYCCPSGSKLENGVCLAPGTINCGGMQCNPLNCHCLGGTACDLGYQCVSDDWIKNICTDQNRKWCENVQDGDGMTCCEPGYVCYPGGGCVPGGPGPTSPPSSNPPSNPPQPTPTRSPSPTPTRSPSPTPTRSPSPTPSPTPTRSPSPTPVPQCNSVCTTSLNCPSGMICSTGFCRNPSCTSQTNCLCPTPSPSPTPTRSPSPTPSPTPVPQCNSTCTANSQCPSGLVCSIATGATSGNCRNPSCTSQTNCLCPTPTPSPIPSPTPGPAAICSSVKAYDTAWTLLSSTDLANLRVGNNIQFCVAGTTTGESFDMARFTINGTLLANTTTKRPASNDFCQAYTIPANVYTFSVTAEIHHTSLGWVGP